MAYLYRHIRTDNNEPFYIGIGEDKDNQINKYIRAKSKYGRNRHWKNIVSKTPYEIEILLENLSWEEACKYEIWWIDFYGRADLGKGPLVNMTNGGEGTNGSILTESHIESIKNHNKGNKHKKGIPCSEDQKILLKTIHRGNKYAKGNKLSQEHIEKIKKVNSGNSYGKGYKQTDEAKERIRKHMIGNSKNSKKTSIICIQNNRKYVSIQEASKELGINASWISKILDVPNKSAKGFSFKKCL